jgi:peptide chain release factor 1
LTRSRRLAFLLLMIDPAYLDKVQARLAEVEREMSAPAAAANQRRYRELVQEHQGLRHIVEKADTVARLRRELEQNRELAGAADAEPELRDLAQGEIAALEARLPAAEKELLVALLPADPNDARDVIMEIRAGTGGEEAALFAGDLFRMYSRHIEDRGWKLSLIDASPSSIGGYKEVVFAVAGTDVYRALKYESGCHRVQRVPVTEASGRIHTSAATVAVLPEAEEVDEIEIPANEMRVDIFCSSGPGGQGVNTTYSAVRITHLPTGLVAQSQDERSQQRNKEKALNVLKARLLDARQRAEEERAGHVRRSQIGTGDRSEKIRTYNFPQNRLTDHRINYTLYTLNRIMAGELAGVIQALQEHDLALRLRQQMAKA